MLFYYRKLWLQTRIFRLKVLYNCYGLDSVLLLSSQFENHRQLSLSMRVLIGLTLASSTCYRPPDRPYSLQLGLVHCCRYLIVAGLRDYCLRN